MEKSKKEKKNGTSRQWCIKSNPGDTGELVGGGSVGIEYMLEADSGKGKSCKCTKWKLTPLPHSMAPVKTAKAYYFWHHKGGGKLNVVC